MLKQAMNNNNPKFYILFCVLYGIQLTRSKIAGRRDDDDDANSGHNLIARDDEEKSDKCWISLKEKNFFEKMDTLDQKYKDVRDAYAREVNMEHFDKRMLDLETSEGPSFHTEHPRELWRPYSPPGTQRHISIYKAISGVIMAAVFCKALKRTRGVAERTLEKFRGNANVIPAGLNLGSYSMMRMPGSMLFFYRLKLRNDTRFEVNYIHNDVSELTLTMRLSLNDLHLLGQYERALTSSEDPSRLYYRPNKGEVEFLLKDVKYKVEGRYRMLDDRLHIEHIISQIPPMQILMRYTGDTAGNSVSLEYANLRDYLDRMQNDLDLWLKDYFNDFLMLYGFEESQKNVKILEYENQKTMIQNDYADQVMVLLNERVRSLASNLMMPDFMLTAVNGMEIKLYDGSVRGFDSMYRRSVATGKRVDDVRHLDADIGFSSLKAEYRYDIYVRTGVPPVSGVFVLNADDISAHMALQVVNYKPSTADLLITFLGHGKPETLTIEGPANRIVANFNHLLEHHIISIMSTTLIHHIRSLSSLTRCDPQLPTKESENVEQRTESIPSNSNDNLEDDITIPIKPDGYDTTELPQNTDVNEQTEMTTNTENEEEPTQLPQYTDDNRIISPDSGETTKFPDEDEPTDPPAYTENDDSTNTYEPTDYDGPTTPPDNSDDDGSTVTPTTDDDDVATAPIDDDLGRTTTPENNDDNYPTDPPPYTEGERSHNYDDTQLLNDETDNATKLKPDYGFARKESIELELPPKPGSAKGDSFKIDHNETFTMTKLKDKDIGSDG